MIILEMKTRSESIKIRDEMHGIFLIEITKDGKTTRRSMTLRALVTFLEEAVK